MEVGIGVGIGGGLGLGGGADVGSGAGGAGVLLGGEAGGVAVRTGRADGLSVTVAASGDAVARAVEWCFAGRGERVGAWATGPRP